MAHANMNVTAILRRLSRRDAILIADTRSTPAAVGEMAGDFIVCDRRTDGTAAPTPRGRDTVPGEVVAAARRDRLVEPAGVGIWRLSRRGRDVARRLQASSSPNGIGPGRSGARAVGASAAWQVDGAIAWLASRRGPDGAPLVGDAECRAGARLRADVLAAGRTASTTIDWARAAEGGSAGGGRAEAVADLLDAAAAARQRVTAALDALGPQLGPVALDACCAELGIAEIERKHGFPPRAGKLMIVCALDQLARHYGLSNGRRRVASPRTHTGA